MVRDLIEAMDQGGHMTGRGAPPRTVVVTTITEWRAVIAPRQCQCGHLHYGRTPHGDSQTAPQWKFCEDADCDCRNLRPAPSWVKAPWRSV